ncbi:MAG: hypothetical protein QG671_1117 [Actinomycetota bacterium]|nr:hypothetical protein [Actinomycetota bacterium]
MGRQIRQQLLIPIPHSGTGTLITGCFGKQLRVTQRRLQPSTGRQSGLLLRRIGDNGGRIGVGHFATAAALP